MTQRKFKIPEVKQIVNAVTHMQEIALEKGEKGPKYITDRCNTIARNIHKDLDIIVDTKTGELTSEPEISFRYYTSLMEKFRNAIKDLGYKHHTIEKHLTSFISKYSSEDEDLETMLDHNLPLAELRENFIKLRAKASTGSRYKSDLLSIKFEHHLFYCLETKGAIKDWIKDDSSKSLKKKLTNAVKANPNWVKKITSDILKDGSASTSNTAVALTIATGRRVTEVMKTAQFKKVDNETLLFSGQLKMKNRGLFEEIRPYEIPSLIEAEVVIKAFKRLRKSTQRDTLKYKDIRGRTVEKTVKDGDIKDKRHNTAINKRYEKMLNNAARVLIGSPSISLSSCRALYTEITYSEHAKPGETRSAYRQRVLGHSLIETQLHYDSFIISLDIEKLVVEDQDQNQKADEHLLQYINKADGKVSSNARAKAMGRIHEWLKEKVSNGLQHEQITVTYIRRNCITDGKQINANTVKKYLGEEYLNIEKYTPPKTEKPKPKSKKQKLRAEILEKIESFAQDADNVADSLEANENLLKDLKEQVSETSDEISYQKDCMQDFADELDDLISEYLKAGGELEDDEITEINLDINWPDDTVSTYL